MPLPTIELIQLNNACGKDDRLSFFRLPSYKSKTKTRKRIFIPFILKGNKRKARPEVHLQSSNHIQCAINQQKLKLGKVLFAQHGCGHYCQHTSSCRIQLISVTVFLRSRSMSLFPFVFGKYSDFDSSPRMCKESSVRAFIWFGSYTNKMISTPKIFWKTHFQCIHNSMGAQQYVNFIFSWYQKQALKN